MNRLYLYQSTYLSLDGNGMIFAERDGSGIREQAKSSKSREKKNSGDGKNRSTHGRNSFSGGFVLYISYMCATADKS